MISVVASHNDRQPRIINDGYKMLEAVGIPVAMGIVEPIVRCHHAKIAVRYEHMVVDEKPLSLLSTLSMISSGLYLIHTVIVIAIDTSSVNLVSMQQQRIFMWILALFSLHDVADSQ